MYVVSVVTGTYNRFDSLVKMVHSVRQSVGLGMSYEIVVVDGGSDDDTINWAKAQPDIYLIQQGELLGAVKAFNDGAKAAKGKYVILANDDIQFVGRSIPRAIAFMEDNRDVGIGCFYQDREGKDWHVEYMPMQYGRKVEHVPYGQVCIISKQLGDYVGWWGDYLHTYGGDNELSCNVWELGLNVLPMDCACVHDMKADDYLRGRNEQHKTNGLSDGQLWANKWFAPGRRGPLFGRYNTPMFVQELPRQQRVVYAPLYEPGNTLQKTTKRGLREALAKKHLVMEVDYMSDGFEGLEHCMQLFQPDILLTQLQDVGTIKPQQIRQLRQGYPNTKFVNWNGDYHPENFLHEDYIFMMKQYDLAGFVSANLVMLQTYLRNRVNYMYWQIGYEEPLYDASAPSHDVVYLANGYLPFRHELVKRLRSVLGANLGLYGSSWPSGWANGSNLYDFSIGAALYRNAKMAISTQEYPDGIGFVSNRLFQALAAGGCMVLQQYFLGMPDRLGLVDGTHLVVWDTIDDLLDKIAYYRVHKNERQEIARNGTNYTKIAHSFDARVQEMKQWLALAT